MACIFSFLAGWDPKQPLLLYVNYGDTHFPYDHRELDDVLGVERLSRKRIRPENAAGVHATYANAAANVDRAIEILVGELRTKIGDGRLAVIVTSDHGEALFEDGVLGHGLALDATQTRVPLVVSGLGGDWPEPIGLSDVRAALQRSLAAPVDAASAKPRFVPVSGRRILQYMAVPEHPRLRCLRGLESELRFDTTDRVSDGRSGARPAVALALARVPNNSYHLPAAIKWPNDVLVRGRKVAGILSEMQSEQDLVRFLVLGIGINVNHSASEMSGPFRYPATSLAIELGHPIARADFLAKLFAGLEKDYDRFRSNGFAELLPELENLSAILGKTVQTTFREQPLSGRAIGLTPEGALRLQLKSGEERVIWVGDVTHIEEVGS